MSQGETIVGLGARTDFVAQAPNADPGRLRFTSDEAAMFSAVGRAMRIDDLIVAGVKSPGFAFLEVLSPCITFRPEEFEWKHKVRHDAVVVENDRAAAAAVALSDDGFSLGLLFRNTGVVTEAPSQTRSSIAAIEQQFMVGAGQ